MNNRDLWTKAAELLGESELSRRFRAWASNLIKKELLKRSNMAPDEFFLHQAGEIISHLNELTGRHYTATPDVQNMIRARLAAGYTVEDFKHVHQAMASRWLEDPKMRDYLRPSTLYRPSHFDEYRALWYADEKKKQPAPAPVADKANNAPTADAAEYKKQVDNLMSIAWWEFETWSDFVRHTLKAPDASSLARYEMPERLRQLRTAPNMTMRVLRNKDIEFASEEYAQIRDDYIQEMNQ